MCVTVFMSTLLGDPKVDVLLLAQEVQVRLFSKQ